MSKVILNKLDKLNSALDIKDKSKFGVLIINENREPTPEEQSKYKTIIINDIPKSHNN